MKKLLTIFLLLAMAGGVYAAPFLVCDPPAADQQITHYEIFKDGILLAATNGTEADGSLKYDMDGITPGQYEFTAKSCNAWGCSTLSNPTQSPSDASAPSGVRMVAE